MKLPQPTLTTKEIKLICEEYTLKEDDILTKTDEEYKLLYALTYLDRADFIIFALYAHFQSERKVAKILGVSRTPTRKALRQIKEKLKTILCSI